MERRTYLALAIFVTASVSPSSGQYVSVIQACSHDIAKICGTGQPGASPLAECVNTHFDNFSETCKSALTRIAAVREACVVKPGGGRILLCVKQHFAAMSESCREAIGHAAERKQGSRWRE